jgi:hypothetical protein
MTTSTQTPAPAAKTVARKAPAAKKPAAAKAAPATVATTSTKIMWTRIEGTGTTKGVPVVGTAGDVEYRITGEGKAWTATVSRDGGKAETLVEGVSRGTAYNAAVKLHKGEAPAASAAA